MSNIKTAIDTTVKAIESGTLLVLSPLLYLVETVSEKFNLSERAEAILLLFLGVLYLGVFIYFIPKLFLGMYIAVLLFLVIYDNCLLFFKK